MRETSIFLYARASCFTLHFLDNPRGRRRSSAPAMSSAVVLQHVEHEGPARIVPVFRDFGIPIDVRHLYRGDEVPTDLDEVRVLVVLSGPMRVPDVGNEKYPFLAKEVETLQRMVAHDRAVLGIGLGGQ